MTQLLPIVIGRPRLEPLQHYRAMEAFCRQRAKMDGEDELFWLAEAELLAELSARANRMKWNNVSLSRQDRRP